MTKSQRCRKMSIILFLSTQYSQYMFILTPLVWHVMYTKHLNPNDITFSANATNNTLDCIRRPHTQAVRLSWLAVSTDEPSNQQTLTSVGNQVYVC